MRVKTVGDESFGQRMVRLKRDRGEQPGGPGRPRLAEKYRPQIAKAERVFATAMPDEAERYVEELAVKEPERCPFHQKVLRCPEDACPITSERTRYDHKAAAYLFDRIMGKPTTRSESTLTVRFVEQVTEAYLFAFRTINDLPDTDARAAAFARECAQLGAQFAGASA